MYSKAHEIERRNKRVLYAVVPIGLHFMNTNLLYLISLTEWLTRFFDMTVNIHVTIQAVRLLLTRKITPIYSHISKQE